MHSVLNMTSNGYDWCPILIIEDWDFCVVVIHTTRECGSIVLCYSSCILWQKLVPCRFYAFTLLYQGSK